ncbi:MAG: DNA recombination protein RmuC [Euzebyales bacterium]|nr:DNA recombination protein RmuC [Euzebyales bacterium]
MPAFVTAIVAAAVTGVVVALVLAHAQRATARRLSEQLLRDAATQRDAGVSAAIDSVVAVAAERLGASTQRAAGELDVRKALIDARLESVSTELGRVTALVRESEGERQRTFGAITEQLRTAGEQTTRLADTTASLREALSSRTARGQWGERMAEDVLRLAGFVENVNYRKQRSSGGGRPDFTFLLPRAMQLHMDVKFPLDNYLRYLQADTDHDRARVKAAFLRDVRDRVTELARRGYGEDDGCVDCVLLFIPNEQLYAFIQENDAAVTEEALRQQVVFCSPLTLFAVLAVVRQAMDNFLLERTSNEILAELGSFRRQWDRYGEQVDKLGRLLESATRAYDDLVTTRTRQLSKPLDRLDDLRAAGRVPAARDATVAAEEQVPIR